jgi:multiple sugar transport system permease protein
MKEKGALWATTLACFAVLIFLVPLLGAVYTAVRTDNAILSGPFVWEFDRGFTHFKNALGAAGYDFPSFFRNSVVISLSTVVLTILVSFPAAYAIVRLGFGGPWFPRLAVGLRITPAIFFVVPFYKLFTTYEMIDTPIALILADTFVNLTLALILFCDAIREIPIEIEEAATVDGASIGTIVLRFILPLLGPGLASVGVLTFLFSWSDYLFAVVLSSSKATPVTVGAANFVTSYGVRWGDISAAVCLSVLPPLVFATAAQRFLVKGLSAGAVKG